MTDKHAWGINTDILFKGGAWEGLLTERHEEMLSLLTRFGEFRPRSEIEDDPTFKQIIPQIILRHGNTILLHRITESSSEARLHDLWPIFIGGHVDRIDADASDIVEAALQRELEEEVTINGQIVNREFLGMIYIEDENPVNHVHIGLIYLFDIDTDDVVSNETDLADLQFVSSKFLHKNIDRLTYWSRVAVKELFAV